MNASKHELYQVLETAGSEALAQALGAAVAVLASGAPAAPAAHAFVLYVGRLCVRVLGARVDAVLKTARERDEAPPATVEEHALIVLKKTASPGLVQDLCAPAIPELSSRTSVRRLQVEAGRELAAANGFATEQWVRPPSDAEDAAGRMSQTVELEGVLSAAFAVFEAAAADADLADDPAS